MLFHVCECKIYFDKALELNYFYCFWAFTSSTRNKKTPHGSLGYLTNLFSLALWKLLYITMQSRANKKIQLAFRRVFTIGCTLWIDLERGPKRATSLFQRGTRRGEKTFPVRSRMQQKRRFLPSSLLCESFGAFRSKLDHARWSVANKHARTLTCRSVGNVKLLESFI